MQTELGVECGENLLKQFQASIKGILLYPPDHPSGTAPIKKAYQTLTSLLKYKSPLTFVFANKMILFENRPILQKPEQLDAFFKRLMESDIEAILFHRGIEEEEFQKFINIVARESEILKENESIINIFKERNIRHIVLKSIETKKINKDELREKAKIVYQKAIDILRDAYREIRLGKIPRSEPFINIAYEMEELILKDSSALLGLTLIKNFDEYTFNHSVNVAIISLALAHSLGIKNPQLRDIGVGALLHDIGKTELALKLINKPGRLTEKEYEEIKKHPVKGSEIARNMDGIGSLPPVLILQHHVHINGKGYPRVDSINPIANIVTTADIYDAMTTARPYQPPLQPREAVERMKGLAGNVIDAEIYSKLLVTFGIFPIGTLLRLDTNEIGMVSWMNPGDPTRPYVKILISSDGNLMENPAEVDLSEKDEKGNYVRNIVSELDPLLLNIDVTKYL